MVIAWRSPRESLSSRRSRKFADRNVICFLTSLRPNFPGIIADDSVRVFFDHLSKLPQRPVKQLDIFLCSNGAVERSPGGWCRSPRVLSEILRMIPVSGYSAARSSRLGADEIVMHPFAELGPIDPTVSNEFKSDEPAQRHAARHQCRGCKRPM